MPSKKQTQPPPGWVKNPQSGRNVKIGSKTWNEMIARQQRQTKENNNNSSSNSFVFNLPEGVVAEIARHANTNTMRELRKTTTWLKKTVNTQRMHQVSEGLKEIITNIEQYANTLPLKARSDGRVWEFDMYSMGIGSFNISCYVVGSAKVYKVYPSALFFKINNVGSQFNQRLAEFQSLTALFAFFDELDKVTFDVSIVDSKISGRTGKLNESFKCKTLLEFWKLVTSKKTKPKAQPKVTILFYVAEKRAFPTFQSTAISKLNLEKPKIEYFVVRPSMFDRIE